MGGGFDRRPQRRNLLPVRALGRAGRHRESLHDHSLHRPSGPAPSPRRQDRGRRSGGRRRRRLGHGPAGAPVRGGSGRLWAGQARARLRQWDRRPGPAADGLGRGTRRRRLRAQLHLRGYRRGRALVRRRAGLHRRGRDDLQHGPGPSGGRHRGDAEGRPSDAARGDRRGPVRTARRLSGHQGHLRQVRPEADRGLGARIRLHPRRRAPAEMGRHHHHQLLPGQASGLLRRRRGGADQ